MVAPRMETTLTQLTLVSHTHMVTTIHIYAVLVMSLMTVCLATASQMELGHYLHLHVPVRPSAK